MAKIKINDVALHAGVSKSTISQYLNGRFDYMSKATKERVAASIKELNYIPNAIARSLKTNKTKTIGVIVRDISGHYTSRSLRGIDDFCKSSQYNVIIYNTDFDPETEKQSLHNLKQLGVDGIIIASSGATNDLIDEFNQADCPVVQFQLEYENCNTNMVVSDYKNAAFEATEHLIKLGHKRICFLTQDFNTVKSRSDRYDGYCSAHEQYNIPLDKELVKYWNRDNSFEQSIQSILNMDNPPSAFFTQHLAITTDFLIEINKLNITMPDDLSLIGFDDLPMAEFFEVPVTIVNQKPYQVGVESAKLLLENINSGNKTIKKITVPCTLEKRMSCREYKNS